MNPRRDALLAALRELLPGATLMPGPGSNVCVVAPYAPGTLTAAMNPETGVVRLSDRADWRHNERRHQTGLCDDDPFEIALALARRLVTRCERDPEKLDALRRCDWRSSLIWALEQDIASLGGDFLDVSDLEEALAFMRVEPDATP